LWIALQGPGGTKESDRKIHGHANLTAIRHFPPLEPPLSSIGDSDSAKRPKYRANCQLFAFWVDELLAPQ